MTRKLTTWLLLLLLCLAPLYTSAEGEVPSPTVLLAASDFQGFPDEGLPPDDIIRDIMARIKEDFPQVNGILFAGDYTRDAACDAGPGIESLRRLIRENGWSDELLVLCQGNHDLLKSGDFASGAIEAETYSMFVIREDDFPQSPINDYRVKQAATKLKTYLDEKIAIGYTKPVFVLTHLPLHYTARGDNSYAHILFEVLNAAGAQGLNIFFLCGHNHSNPYDNEIGFNICLLPGDEIFVMTDSMETPLYDHLAFTYMNCGYVSVDVGGAEQSMTVFVIEGDAVTLYRYGKNGVIDLKSPGKQSRFNLASYKSTYPSPQTVPAPDTDGEK